MQMLKSPRRCSPERARRWTDSTPETAFIMLATNVWKRYCGRRFATRLDRIRVILKPLSMPVESICKVHNLPRTHGNRLGSSLKGVGKSEFGGGLAIAQGGSRLA